MAKNDLILCSTNGNRRITQFFVTGSILKIIIGPKRESNSGPLTPQAAALFITPLPLGPPMALR